jgi:hypothetical protein
MVGKRPRWQRAVETQASPSAASANQANLLALTRYPHDLRDVGRNCHIARYSKPEKAAVVLSKSMSVKLQIVPPNPSMLQAERLELERDFSMIKMHQYQPPVQCSEV